MKFRHLLAGLILAATMLPAMSAHGQAPGGSLQIVSVSDAGYPNARAIVTLEQTGTSTAPELAAGDVTVTLGDQPAKVLSAKLASSTENPLDVVMVIDASGSMAGRPIELAKEATKSFIQKLSPGDRVAVLYFGSDVHLLQDFTDDHDAAAAAVDSVTASGTTAIYKATAAAALKAGTSAASRRAIVFLSDGGVGDIAGETTREQAYTAVKNVRAPVFAIGEGTDLDRDYLNQLALLTNGLYVEAPDPNQLGALYDGIARLLQSQYEITFDASAVSGTNGVPLTISLRTGETTVTAQSTYSPVVAPQPTVSIDGLSDGAALSSKTTVTARVTGPAAVTGVTFRIDGNDVATVSSPPYAYVYDPASFGAGPHEFSVLVDSAGGAVGSKLTFTSAPPAHGGGGGSSNLPLFLAVGGIAALLIAAAAIWLARRRSRGSAPLGANIGAFRVATPRVASPPPEDAAAASPREVVEEAKGILISRGGSDLGAEYAVGGSPVSIGSADHCGVRIPDRGLSSVEARIWVRGQQLMVHRMMSLNALANEGTTGGWTILDPGDTFDLGPHQFEFRLVPVAVPVEEPSDVADVLKERPAARPAGAPGGFSAAPAQASHLRLVELMPKNDVQQPADGEERAS